MTIMKKSLLPLPAILVAATVFTVRTAVAQEGMSAVPVSELSTPAATPEELEAVYTTAIEGRTAEILKALNLSDAAKADQVHDLIIAQYRVLRARDAFIDATLKAEGKEINYANRAGQLEAGTRPLHDQFVAKLSALLTPQQVETVKDKLTYNKVKVTYDAYLNIIPNLTEADKAKILELLKAAREEAMDGGSAPEKSAIFQKYKNQINDYLNTHGHDVAQAYKDWEARQATAKTAAPATAAK